MSGIPNPPISHELPPGNPTGEPSAAAPSNADNTTAQKATEPVVPIYKEEEIDTPPPLSYRDDVVVDSQKAEELEEAVGESAKEEVKVKEQGNDWYSNLEQAKEESES